MSILDIQNELKSLQNNTNNKNEKQDNSINNSEKYESCSKLESFLNSKVINIYERPWKKLELKLKIKKIKEYMIKENIEENKKNIYIDDLVKLLKNKKKKINLTYNEEKGFIEKLDYESI